MPNLDRESARGTAYESHWDTPSHWPRDVRLISIDEFDHLGLNPQTMQLYWDGHELVTKRRLADFERNLAIAALVITGVGVAAAVVQAWAAWVALSP